MSVMEVSQSFDDLWNQQDGKQVLLSLRRLREELLRCEMSPDDMSEAFLAIQGAALRFRPPTPLQPEGVCDWKHVTVPSMDEATTRIHWSITEEALGLVTVLSCTCVGPAWRHQIRERRLLLSKRKAYGDENQSQPRRNASEFRFPQVPEILPAAILRFAASILSLFAHETSDSAMPKTESRQWQERKANIAVSQRYLVLALCSQTPLISQEVGYNVFESEGSFNELQYGPRETTWSVPGVIEVVEEMVLFWLRLATEPKPSNDWSCTCQVTNAISEMTSVGWRARPDNNAGVLVVQYLFDIAEMEIDFEEMWHGTSHSRHKETHRSGYYQAAMNSIRALAHLANRGSLPLHLQKSVMFRAFRLNVAFERSKSLLSGLGPYGEKIEPAETTDNSKAAFRVQMDLLSSESADLVWALLNSDSSDTAAMQALFEVIKNPNLVLMARASDNFDSREYVVKGVAIRMASSSLWRRGSIPRVEYSERCLQLVRELSRTMHSKVMNSKQGESDEENSTVNSGPEAYSVHEPLLLALDTVISLGIFADRQLSDPENKTSANEWGVFIPAVKEAFLAWQDYSSTRRPTSGRFADAVNRLLDRAQLECMSLVLRIGACLDKFVQMERSPFHAIVTNSNQKALYLFILRVAVVMIPPADAELLGLTAFRAWVKFLRQPMNVAHRFAEIVIEGFSKYPDGTYVHSAKIRETCLKLLSMKIGENKLISLEANVALRGQSLMHMMNIRSSATINDVVIPVLQSILVAGFPSPQAEIVLSSNRNAPAHMKGAALLTGDKFGSKRHESSSCFSLKSLAVSLVGELVRDNASAKHLRFALLDSLVAVAMSPVEQRQGEEMSSQHDSIHLRAVVELHSCLLAPFGNLPLIHGILPKVVDSLRSILVAQLQLNPFHPPSFHVSQVVLAMASLLALCRLRPIVRGARLSAVPFRRLEKSLPQSVAPTLVKPKLPLDIQSVRVARFVQLLEGNDGNVVNSAHQVGEQSTWLDFELVTKALTAALDASRSSRDTLSPEVSLLLQSVASMCFHALTEVALCGFSPCNYEDLNTVIFASEIICSESVQETYGKSQMLAALAECTIAVHAGRSNRGNFSVAGSAHTDSLLNLTLDVCDSSRLTESVVGCRAVLAILPSLISIDCFQGSKRVANIFARIKKRLESLLVTLRHSRSLLHQIDEVTIFMSIQQEILMSTKIVLEDALRFVDLCKEILEVVILLPPSLCLHLTMQCLFVSIQRLSKDALKQLWGNRSKLQLHSLTQLDTASAAGQPAETKEFVELMLLECVKHCLNDAPVESSGTVAGHERMAQEVDQMDRFQVDRYRGSEEEMKGVWLCDDSSLISIRKGSSRYKGWVELVVRSPSSCRRKIIQLPPSFSVADPGRISMIWSQSQVSRAKGIKEPPTKSSTEPNLAKYSTLIKRCDNLLSLLAKREGGKPPLSDSEQLGEQVRTVTGGTENELLRAEKNGNETILAWLKKHVDAEESVEVVKRSIIADLSIPEELITYDTPFCSETGSKLPPIQQLENGKQLDRAMTILDRTNPASAHKIGILYAGPLVEDTKKNLDPETFLISVRSCSPSFIQFTEDLGDLVPTRQLRYFSGGLDVSDNESDGRYARVWIRNEHLCIAASKSIVVYHILHLMETGLNNRKRHVGNDNVLVIFLETDPAVGVDVDYSEERLRESIVSGHFGFATIFVSLGATKGNLAKVTVLIREGLQNSLGSFAGTNIVARTHAAKFVRSLAVRIDLACKTVVANLAPPSNCMERCRMIKQLKRFRFSDTPAASRTKRC